jgi:long-chain acyl-CoA synthetase
VEGLEHLATIQAPVVYAANHQSHMDGPAILAALPSDRRYRVATAASKEFFAAHFHPERHGHRARFTSSLNYYLASLFFNIFPLPQREAGAREAIRYLGELLGDGSSVLIFPEGRRSQTGEIDSFQPGIGMIASRLQVPIVPVRLDGLDRILHQSWRMARPGRARVAFGAPLWLEGNDYRALAKRVENTVKTL